MENKPVSDLNKFKRLVAKFFVASYLVAIALIQSELSLKIKFEDFLVVLYCHQFLPLINCYHGICKLENLSQGKIKCFSTKRDSIFWPNMLVLMLRVILAYF